MSVTGEKLAEQVLALPIEERAELADRLAASLDPAIDQLWAAEAQRRLEEVRSGKVQTISADEALRQVRQALGE